MKKNILLMLVVLFALLLVTTVVTQNTSDEKAKSSCCTMMTNKQHNCPADTTCQAMNANKDTTNCKNMGNECWKNGCKEFCCTHDKSSVNKEKGTCPMHKKAEDKHAPKN